jgi:hypothetical protein
MKKFIQAASFLALALVFGSVAANAQSATKIDANVPFDFVIGNQYLKAGQYVIRIAGTPSGAKHVELRDKEGNIVYNALAVTNGDRGEGRSELVFDRTDGRTVLTKILTEDVGYSVPAADISKLVASIKR